MGLVWVRVVSGQDSAGLGVGWGQGRVGLEMGQGRVRG